MSKKKVFSKLFSNSPTAKILDAFFSTKHDLTITQLSKLSSVSRTTIYEILEKLEEYELIHKTRKIGTSQLYGCDFDFNNILFSTYTKLMVYFYE